MNPLKNRIIVEIQEKEMVTESGIVLSHTDKYEADKGLVIAVGPDVLDVKVGEVILADWNKAQKIGKDRYVVSEDFVILVFEE